MLCCIVLCQFCIFFPISFWCCKKIKRKKNKTTIDGDLVTKLCFKTNFITLYTPIYTHNSRPYWCLL